MSQQQAGLREVLWTEIVKILKNSEIAGILSFYLVPPVPSFHGRNKININLKR